MKLPLSKRLLACCDFVTPGDRVADVGCDHGYLSIFLVKSGLASSVIASDINEGPLQAAVTHAEKYGVSGKIRFFLSDGVRKIPRDFDTLVCAGMGADVMISILDAAPWLRSADYRLILQCQSRTPRLRRFLADSGWRIARETVVRDGRFLYTVMNVVWQPGCSLTAGECWFPPALLVKPSPETGEYYRRCIRQLQIAVNGKGAQADPIQKEALAELQANVPNIVKEGTL